MAERSKRWHEGAGGGEPAVGGTKADVSEVRGRLRARAPRAAAYRAADTHVEQLRADIDVAVEEGKRLREEIEARIARAEPAVERRRGASEPEGGPERR